MSSIREVADGIASVIAEGTGLRTFGYVPEDINPPLVFLALGPIERGAFSMGQMEFTVEAALFTSKASDRAGQQSAYEFASWDNVKSVWDAMNANKSLGLSDTDCAVLRYRPLGVEEIAGYGYFGGVFEILVLTAGA